MRHHRNLQTKFKIIRRDTCQRVSLFSFPGIHQKSQHYKEIKIKIIKERGSKAVGTMHYFNRDFNQNFNRDFKDSFSPGHTQTPTRTPMHTHFRYNSSELLETVQRRKRMLNAKVNITLAKKTPPDDNVTIDGVEYHVDYEDKRYRDLLQNLYTSRTGIRYEWFKEERGYKHWVLYNTEQFEVMTEQTENISYLNTCQSKTMPKQINFLHYKHREITEEDSDKLEFPINLTSCFLMFKGTRFNNAHHTSTHNTSKMTTSNGTTSKITTSKVIDFIGTFSHTVFKGGSQLPEGLDTSNAVKMDGMFYSAELLNKVKLPENFITENVVSMEYMFARSFLNDELVFPKGFSTGNVFTMDGMFYASTLMGNPFDLSFSTECFNTKNVIDMSEMFNAATTQVRNFKLPKNFSTENLIYTKRMFYSGALNIQFYKNNKTNKQIIEILKEYGSQGKPI